MAPFFSVIISTFNRDKLILRAIKSLISQTETNWEALIIDDGSTDNTLSELKPYLENDLRINYHSKEHQGQSYAINFAFTLFKGAYITFLDADDTYAANHLASRKEILIENNYPPFLHGGVNIIGSEYVPDRNNPSKQIHLSECAIGGTFFFKKELIHQVGSYKNIVLGSDADYFERIEKAGIHILKTELPTYIYHREEDDSITNTINKQNTTF